MKSKDQNLYWILSFLSLAGSVWVGYHLYLHQGDNHSDFTVCIFKNITGLACPSCGITRSVICLLHGDVALALYINPLGILALGCLIVIPIWLVYDVITHSQSLAAKFWWAEEKLKKEKLLYVPLIVLMAFNWGWNIFKNL